MTYSTSSSGVSTLAYWERTSNTIDSWYRNDCHGDVPCTFFYIRANLCNKLDGGAKLICYAGTEHNRHGRYGAGNGTLTMDSSFYLFLTAREQQGQDCLALDNNGPVDWILLNRGERGCQH
jgi:hypothetical protein